MSPTFGNCRKLLPAETRALRLFSWRGWPLTRRCCGVFGAAGLALALFLPAHGFAGGSGLNTVVIINGASSNSCEVGNYYCERRQIPPDNVLRISWTGGDIYRAARNFQNVVINQLVGM